MTADNPPGSGSNIPGHGKDDKGGGAYRRYHHSVFDGKKREYDKYDDGRQKALIKIVLP